MINKKILDKYLAGEGTQQERDLIIQWFSSMEEESSLRKESLSTWENPDPQILLSENMAERLLDKIHHRIRLSEKPLHVKQRPALRYLRILSRVAAVLFIPLLIFMWTLREQIFTSGSEELFAEIVCPMGTRTKFHLPDNSSGWLNGGSTLKFPTKFKGKTREVFLSGEGYFDVESNPRKPFIVSTDHIAVKVYGTSFNVMAYATDNISEVSLAEGSVEVLGARNITKQRFGMLKPGEKFSFNHNSSKFQIRKADIEKAISWTNNKLIFRDDSFADMVKKFNRWFNVDIVISDSELESYTYVGTFQDETLDEVLKLLSLTAPIEYKDLGRTNLEDGTFAKRRIELRLKRYK